MKYRAAVVTQFVERLLPKPEVHGTKPIKNINEQYIFLKLLFRKDDNKGKRRRYLPILKR